MAEGHSAGSPLSVPALHCFLTSQPSSQDNTLAAPYLCFQSCFFQGHQRKCKTEQTIFNPLVQ